MKKLLIILPLLALSLVSLKTPDAATWKLDNLHSQLGFAVSLFGLSDIKGTFTIRESSLVVTKDDFSDASVTLTANAKSIDTDVDDRDKHLRTAEYFDTDKFPDIVFKSTSFKKISDGNYLVEGDLSFHGITKPVTLKALAKIGTHPVSKKPAAGFKVTGTISRSEFGISPATPAAMLSDEVAIEANLQYAKE